MKLTFPEGFLWGTSTAAAQIETASDHNWKGLKSKDGFTFGRTVDHEKRRDEDLGYISQFGSVYRCGVDWARLQPEAFAPFDETVVEEYQEWFRKLNAEGMKIMFVIHHFTNPMWFENKNSWLNEDNIPAFVDYAKKCIEHFGDYAYIWNTFNEPGVYCMSGYILGEFPPHKKNIFKGSRCVKHMGKAHDIVYDMIKKAYPDKEVGISKNTCYFFGTNIFGKAVAKFVDWWFIDFVAKHFQKLDFWGLSYYAYVPFTPFPVTEIDNPGKLKKMGIPNDKMWGYYPKGFGEIMRRFYKKYGKPIIITENGVCTEDDAFRQQSIKDYLKVCHEVIKEGVPLKGYIHWTTMDNFEWALGPTYRFGLVRVNLDTMDRTMTGAGKFYAKITKENEVEV